MTEQNQATKTSRSGDIMDYAHTQRSTISRGMIAAASTAAAVLVLTGCSDTSEGAEAADTEEAAVAEEENQEQEWFAAECPTITADVRFADENQEPTGEIVDTALIQGPVSPPEGLDESTMTIGMYSYDELANALVFEKIATESDVFCLTADLDEGPDSDTEFVGQDAETLPGLMHHMRTFANPEGFWVDQDFMTTGASVPGVIIDHECPGAWTVAEDLADLENAEHQEAGVSSLHMQGADNALCE